VFAKAREKARQTQCLNNQKQIATAVLMYAQDHDELCPSPATVWGDLGLDKGVLQCPTLGNKIPNGYLYSIDVAGKALGELPRNPDTMLMSIDGLTYKMALLQDNATAPQANVAYYAKQFDARHLGKVIAAFADGHVEITDANSVPFDSFFSLPMEIPAQIKSINVPWGASSLIADLFTASSGTGVTQIRYRNSQDGALGYYKGANRVTTHPSWVSTITEVQATSTAGAPGNSALRETANGYYAFGALYYNDNNGANPYNGTNWTCTITAASSVKPEGEMKLFGISMAGCAYFSGYTNTPGTMNIGVTVNGITCPVISTGTPIKFSFNRGGAPYQYMNIYKIPVKPGATIVITLNGITGHTLGGNWSFTAYELF
jgi:prepilin-type processing-associated H-X9-DG protein